MTTKIHIRGRGLPMRFSFRAAASPSQCRGQEDLVFFGDGEAERLFNEAVQRLESIGGRARRIDFAPFLEAALLLYEGPSVAERTVAVGSFIEAHEAECDPTVAKIVLGGRTRSAVETFEAMHKLQALQRKVRTLFAGLDIVVVPTAPTTYKVSELEAEPIKLNSRLGTYTNFMNLLDMAGLAVPAGIGTTGLPFGITLAAPAFSEARLIEIGARFGAALGLAPGAPFLGGAEADEGFLELAVVGAHMSGLPLNRTSPRAAACSSSAPRQRPVTRFMRWRVRSLIADSLQGPRRAGISSARKKRRPICRSGTFPIPF